MKQYSKEKPDGTCSDQHSLCVIFTSRYRFESTPLELHSIEIISVIGVTCPLFVPTGVPYMEYVNAHLCMVYIYAEAFWFTIQLSLRRESSIVACVLCTDKNEEP